MADYIKQTRDGHVVVLTIDRPDALNALNAAVLRELEMAFAEIEQTAARAVIIHGAGPRSFVAGADVAEMLPFTVVEARDFAALGHRVFSKINRAPLPVIAAINGFCLGGGLELALACDLRIASERATFSLPETSLGIIPGFGGTVRLARIVGEANAFDLIYTNRRIKAEEALRMGLVMGVYPDELLIQEAMVLAGHLAEKAPLAMKAAKHSLRFGLEHDLDRALEEETRVFSELFASDDQKEGMAALLEKRDHDGFKGR